ncbi:GMC family oxidoreductase [Thalassotalea sp. PLHSN55]|uniref:GMC family oxidoreductase n=1 Tax=Thalassotalea sp. PLHSN55 TaxID=3435888 RepID=UPI003F849B22
MKASSEIFDVCVIGTGAGGGVMIDQLTAAGMRVVALERGPHFTQADFDEDELKNIVRKNVFAEGKVDCYRPDKNSPTESGNIAEIVHGVGGSITHWGAWAWRFREDDFHVLSKEGPIAGASLADWPISYFDLEPYYNRAELDFGVAGVAGSNPFDAPRKQAYPNPPHPWRPSSHKFAHGAKKMGYTPFSLPVAINSQVYGNRPPCMQGGACRSNGCPINAKATTFSVSLPRAMATGLLDLRAEATVYDLPLNKEGKIIGARYLDANGNQHEVKAKHVILAAGAIGTAQLLLMAKSSQFPQGLANGSGQVGKNYTFHHYPAVAGVFEEDLRTYTGIESLVAVDDLHPSDAKRGFIRGGVFSESNALSNQPLAFAAGLHGATEGARWGAGFKDKLREFPRTMVIAGICEELPMESNQVDLDPEIKDKSGLPAPRITKKHHQNDIDMHQWFLKRINEVAVASGASKVLPVRIPGSFIDKDNALKSNPHNHGTCRMGNDPSKSVVNKWCQSHEVPNLWITDASVFPTAGGYNPTLTILANAYRVADYFIEQAKSQSI